MLQKIHINGFKYYADVNARILYTDEEKKNGTPFNYLTADEKTQMENELRFPRKENEEEL
jgi:hypothetical protein